MRLGVLLIFFLTLTSSGFSQNNKKLRVVTSNYPPYQGQELPDGGVFDNLALSVLKEAGYKVDLVYRPWSRAMKEVKEGQADAIFGVWVNKDRKEWLEFSPPLIENSMVLLCLAKNPECKAAPHLKGKTLGLVLGYSYPKEIQDSEALTEYEQTEEVNFKKLLGRRIQYMLADRSVAFYFMQKRNLQFGVDIRVLEPSVATQNLHIGFSKQSDMGLAAGLELPKTLRRLEKSGKLKPLRTEALRQEIRIFNF